MKKKGKNSELRELKLSGIPKNILLFAGLLFIAFFFCHKIVFVNADLGRHLKNGEVILSGLSSGASVLTSNFYSYTEKDFPLVNHHWGSGVIFFLVWKLFGFSGLSLFHVLINVASAFLFFKIAERKSNFVYSFFFLILSVPLITSRTEIRPEDFSVLLAGVFYYILVLFVEEKISYPKILFFLLPLQILWANLHIFFVFGFFLTGVFWLGAFMNNRGLFRNLSVMLFLQVGLCLINPSWVSGLAEPFMILREYGYMIAENQPLFFMQKRFPEMAMYYHFEFLLVLSAVIFFIAFYRNRNFLFNPSLIILLFFSILSFNMVRGIPLWGLFFIPFASVSFYSLGKKYFEISPRILQGILLGCGLLIVFLGMVTRGHYYSPFRGYSGFGLIKDINRPADFFRMNHLEGPVFNNYDIGGYLIFNLFPGNRVFVDNRPEAYSVDFFKKIYEPMQENEEDWNKYSGQFQFNSIFFFRHDNTPHAQPFLIRRINDPSWAPVFVDDFTIILLKRNNMNAQLIGKYELPRSMFTSVPQ